jgi:hypothetical protein
VFEGEGFDEFLDSAAEVAQVAVVVKTLCFWDRREEEVVYLGEAGLDVFEN